MIKKKPRFDYMNYDDGTSSIYDRKEDEYYFDSELDSIEELLNSLNDENEQLKHDATVLICSNQEYRKENEELKEEIKDLNDVLARYEEKELKE